MKYDRLTKKDWAKDKYAVESYKRLAELEDKIEQGKLIESPCKVGQKAWFVIAKSEYSEIRETTVKEVAIFENGEWIVYLHGTVRQISNNPEKCSYAYLDKAEAEAKLKELRGEVE